MAAPSYGLRVEGLREFRKTLKQADSGIGPALREANKSVAELVAAEARSNAATQPRVRAANPRPSRQHWGDYVRSFRALASQTRAQVALGAAKLPWAMGQNFGSVSARRSQFPPSLGHRGGDYALYKAIGETIPQQVAEFTEQTDKVWAIAFPDPPA